MLYDPQLTNTEQGFQGTREGSCISWLCSLSTSNYWKSVVFCPSVTLVIKFFHPQNYRFYRSYIIPEYCTITPLVLPRLPRLTLLKSGNRVQRMGFLLMQINCTSNIGKQSGLFYQQQHHVFHNMIWNCIIVGIA